MERVVPLEHPGSHSHMVDKTESNHMRPRADNVSRALCGEVRKDGRGAKRFIAKWCGAGITTGGSSTCTLRSPVAEKGMGRV